MAISTILSLLGCLFLLTARAQKRLYYTGKFKNDQTNTVTFDGGKVLHSDLFEFSNLVEDWIPDFNSSFLYSGQTFLRLKHVNVTIDDELWEFVANEINELDSDVVYLKTASFYKQISSYTYGSAMTGEDLDSNDFLLEAEIGLYDHSQDIFLEKYWREISGGDLIAVKAVTSRTTEDVSTIPSSDDPTVSNSVEAESSLLSRTHKLVFSRDFMGRVSALSHSWSEEEEEEEDRNSSTSTTGGDGELASRSDGALSNSSLLAAVEGDVVSTPLRVMTYNLWHNNPPSWIYHDKRARWNRYDDRMRHFADVVVAADPDVLTLQEVRHDSGFTSTSKRTAHWLDSNRSKEDAGSQVEHLLSHLAQARKRAALAKNESNSADRNETNYYQFVFQPAMSMLDRARLVHRNEEGLLILSKLPILDSDVLLLPRQIGEASDDHQRIVLRVKVALESSPLSPTVDVMTTHLSLSESARDLASREIIRLSTCSQPHVKNTNRRSSDTSSSFELSPVQVLTGDFNAEPQENFIKHLLHSDSYSEPGCPAGSDTPSKSEPFVDSWLEHFTRTSGLVSPAAESVSTTNDIVTEVDVAGNIVETRQADQASTAELEGHTFPSCNPIKRIDFVMVRNHSVAATSKQQISRSAYVTVERSHITGQRPSADTEHLVGSREGLGMNDHDSPVWASDHFAVVTDLIVHHSSRR